MHLTQECGQRWYWHSSWFVWRRIDGKYRRVWTGQFRKLKTNNKTVGYALGPIMFFFGRA